MKKRHGWGLALGLALAALACSGKRRDFANGVYVSGSSGASSAGAAGFGASSSAGGGPADEGPAFTPPVGAALGIACGRDMECASGFCVDGVCCDGRCGEPCATCNAPDQIGTCGPASSDPACGALACAGGSECRGYDQTQLEQNCEAFGRCRSGIACAPLDQPAGTPCQAGAGACDGLGQCVVPGKALLGTTCVEDADCGEGHCVAGPGGTTMCCDSACDGVCEQCSAAGRCTEAPLHDADCPAVVCPGDSICRDYVDSITENLCRGFGQCKAAIDCGFEASRVDSACECGTDGSCSLARGQRCTESAECGAQACAPSVLGENICCAAACGAGLACSQDGTRCVECEGEEVRCDGVSELRCISDELVRTDCPNGCSPGAGCNALAPIGFACELVACQPGGVCQVDVSGARRCCSRDCAAEGKVCTESGSCACPEGVSAGAGASCLLQLGDPCGPETAACEVGLTCVDGVCCSEACGGACEACNLPGAAGQCTFSAVDTALCALGETCVGRSDCRLTSGQACDGDDGRCVSGNCEAGLGGANSPVCCAEACGAERPSCSRDGSRCLQCETNADCPNGCQDGLCLPPRALGELCDVASQCGSGVCTRINGTATSRCCGQCLGGQVCNATGGCECPPNQVLVAGQCRKVQGQSCQSGAECESANCEVSVDGQNRCCAAGCGDPSASRCAQDGAGCIDQRGGVGAECAVSTDCQLGNCVDGFCCDGPCSNACERCNAPGQEGLCAADAAGSPCNGGSACFGRNQCLPSVGQACTLATGCGTGVCIPSALRQGDEICCAEDCGAALPFCSADGTGCIACIEDANCANGCNTQTGQCNAGAENGSACTANDQCVGNRCLVHYVDPDDDEFAVVGAATSMLCAGVGFDLAGFTTRQPGAADLTDCEEGNANVFPGQGVDFPTPIPGRTTRPFDYDCDGQEASADPAKNLIQDCRNEALGECEDRGKWVGAEGVPACGEEGQLANCGEDSLLGCTSFFGGPSIRPCK